MLHACDSVKTYDVVFIGRYERERYYSIKYLSDNGIAVNVWGSGWPRDNSGNMIIHGRSIWGKEFVDTVCKSKIVLNFLRKANDDLTTGRTFEIPAIGSFMLSYRTKEQKEIFKESLHAEYFSTNEELLRKVKIYLKNEEKRVSIESKGHELCLGGEFTHENICRGIIKSVGQNI